MNTQHKVGCTDLGCPGCDAGDPRPNPPQANFVSDKQYGDGQTCSDCGAAMVEIGSCDMSCGVKHRRNHNGSGDTTPNNPCVNFKPSHFECLSCGSTTGCTAGDPPSVTEPEKCPSCHSNERKRNLCDARLAGHRNIRFEAHLPTYKRCVTCRDPWHNAAQPEPREEVSNVRRESAGRTDVEDADGIRGDLGNDPRNRIRDGDGGNYSRSDGSENPKVAVANTPQPDRDQENVQFTIWAEDYMRRKGLTRLIGARDAWLAARRLSPDRKLVEAANLLIDYCEAHNWGMMPEPFASINPLLQLLGRNPYTETQEPAPKEEK